MPHDMGKSGQQKAAEADVANFKQKLGPFVVAAETTRMPMVFTDAKASGMPIIFANQAFLNLTGYEEHDVLGQSFDFMMERGTNPEAVAEIRMAFEGARGLETQVRYRRKDDSLFWATIFINPVQDEDGDVVQHFASFVDITRHKEEDRLRFLLDELNHRTQNTLTTVLAIAQQTLRRTTDEEVLSFFEGRILALAKVQALLGGVSWERVSLRDVLDQVLQPFGLDDLRAACFSIQGAEVRLQPKTALTLAMVFHELATNAVKHGAISGKSRGNISVGWQTELTPDGDRLRLRWEESGGPTVSPPTYKGFGSRLIEQGLAKDLDGEVRLEYAPTGVVCQIVMPFPRARAMSRT